MHDSILQQWKWIWLNQKIVYNIAPKMILGCCKVSDDSYKNIVSTVDQNGLYAWTLTSDNYIVAANRSTGAVATIADGEYFCFICY